MTDGNAATRFVVCSRTPVARRRITSFSSLCAVHTVGSTQFTILDLAALSAVRHNPALKAFRDRLSARGKKPKVILTAVARKLLVIANAVIRTGLPWDPALAMAR